MKTRCCHTVVIEALEFSVTNEESMKYWMLVILSIWIYLVEGMYLKMSASSISHRPCVPMMVEK